MRTACNVSYPAFRIMLCSKVDAHRKGRTMQSSGHDAVLVVKLNSNALYSALMIHCGRGDISVQSDVMTATWTGRTGCKSHAQLLQALQVEISR